MKRVIELLARRLLIGAALWNALPAFAGSDAPNAGELITRVIEARQTAGYRVRARLVRTATGSDHRDIKQLLVKGRRDGEASKVLYQILWPRRSMGQTLVIEKSAGQSARSWIFTPPEQVTTLTQEHSGDPFFGSDLTIEDMAEEFWLWPAQEIAGEGTVDRRRCRILESRPSASTPTSYSLVRTWIAPDIALPLRIEKYGHEGQLIKRITMENIAKLKNHRWTAINVLVEPADGQTRTELEGSNADRDIDVPAEDFTVEKIKAALRPKP